VKEAEAAITSRTQELRASRDRNPDRQALADALRSLRYVRNEHFKFSTIGNVEQAADGLARSERSSQRFYSMSVQIRQERAACYDMLERTQKAETDITEWLRWFLECLRRAIDGAETLLGSVFTKARFCEGLGASPINDRQRLILNELLDGFEGKLTSSKCAKLTKASQDTAQRDITDLVERGILVRSAEGGRSTSYGMVPRKSLRDRRG
jgi:predicted HTH transcriptional regulator